MPSRNGQRGYTLIEILVAGVILALGILATATVFASSDSTTLDAELQQTATEQAERAIEEIRALDYDQVGHTETPAAEPTPAEGDGGLGGGAGPTYDGPDNEPEELVVPGNSEGGDSDSGVITPALAARTFTVETDPGSGTAETITGTVYTFVTWRDEECEALDLGALGAGLTELRDDLSALRNGLDGLVADVGGIFPSTSLLPVSMRNLYESKFPAAADDVDGAIGAIDALIAGLAGATVDLCDLTDEGVDAIQGLVDPTGSGGLTASAEILGVSAEVGAAVDGVDVPLVQSLLCSVLGTFCADSTSLEAKLTSADLEDVMEAAEADAQTIDALLDHATTHNTKRVTVAVTIDTGRDDLTPRNTVYLSSVVIDPEDGLL